MKKKTSSRDSTVAMRLIGMRFSNSHKKFKSCLRYAIFHSWELSWNEFRIPFLVRVKSESDMSNPDLSFNFHIFFLDHQIIIHQTNLIMSAYALPDLFHTPTNFSFTEEKRDESENLGIAIKEARVDSALLIQTLMGQTKQSTTTSSSQRKRRQARMGCDTGSPHPSYHEALGFELCISLNGRKYTALRSLPSFEELRKDLLEEVDTDIPELCFDESVQGHSFSFLQGILQSYIPTVERWLKEVTKRVSPTSSPSLRSFLWEPVTKPEYLHRDSSCSSQLDRIEETETDELEDDFSF